MNLVDGKHDKAVAAIESGRLMKRHTLEVYSSLADLFRHRQVGPGKNRLLRMTVEDDPVADFALYGDGMHRNMKMQL